MTQFKSNASAGNLAVIASWLEEPCHFNSKRQGWREYALTKSFRYITAMNDVLHSDADNSDKIRAGNRETMDSGSEIALEEEHSATQTRKHSKSSLPPELQHPGVETLLDEYYRVRLRFLTSIEI